MPRSGDLPVHRPLILGYIHALQVQSQPLLLEMTQREGPATDLSKWRLCCNDKGRQRWVYLEKERSETEENEDVRLANREQDFVELHSLGLDTVSMSHTLNIYNNALADLRFCHRYSTANIY